MEENKISSFKKLAKRTSLAIIIAAVMYLAFIYMSEFYKDYKELNYAAENEWRWHDKNQRVQIRNRDDGFSTLRKVFYENNSVVYAVKNPDYSVSSLARFNVDCEPKSEISTSKKFERGNSKKLYCSDEGDFLYYNVKWSKKGDTNNFDVYWTENLDGFVIDVDFSLWRFEKLDREITLSKQVSEPNNAQ